MAALGAAIAAARTLRQPDKALLLCAVLATLFVAVKDEFTASLFYPTARVEPATQHQQQQETTLYLPSALLDDDDDEEEAYRRLATSIDLGGGKCKWQPPNYEVPDDVDFFKTLIAGYPSGDKRMIWLQMEALAGWPAKDEWDFAYLGMTNHPFIKANYPHHEGFWGWGDVADQVVIMVPYIRRSMVEYHDILADLGYPVDWEDPAIRQDLLYNDRPNITQMYEWRDTRVLDEIHWYGWFIDYWMEAGLLRDIFTHKLVTYEHWQELMLRPFYAREDLNYERWGDPNAVVTPTYDPHCGANDNNGNGGGEITHGCEPIEVISADKLLEFDPGPAETARVANALKSDHRTGDAVIPQRTWNCIWNELIVKKKGPKTIRQRAGGYVNADFNFSPEMLNEMIRELNRLTTKYSGTNWSDKPTANRLVELLMEHTFFLQAELGEVLSGERKLRDGDFLGPKTRGNRRMRKWERDQGATTESDKGMSPTNRRQQPEVQHDHFSKILQHKFWKKRRGIRIFRERRKAAEMKANQRA